MAKMKYWNGTQWVPLDAADAETLEGLTVSQVRSGTTKTDVGLGNVDNVKQASKTEFDSHLSDYATPHIYQDISTNPDFAGVKYKLVIEEGNAYLEVVEA